MKKYYYILLILLLIVLLNPDLMMGQFRGWIYEERGAADGWWHFTWAGTSGGGDMLLTNPPGGSGIVDIPTSVDSYEGNRSLLLNYTHNKGTGWCFGAITTSSAFITGIECANWPEADMGKDISQCDAIEFYVKATNALGVNTFRIEIKDVNDKGTDKVILKDYETLTDTAWHFVQIPLDDFSWKSGLDNTQIKNINFLIEQYDPSGTWTLLIDNFKFTNANLTSNPKFKLIYEDSDNVDMKWNYSGVVTNEDGGLSIKTSPDADHNIPINTNEKYKGNTSLEIEVNKTSPNGWGFIWMSCNSNGYGTPPPNTSHYDAPKDISSYSALNFWIKGDTNTLGRIEFVDINTNLSGKIEITDHVWVTNGWQKVVVPFDDIDWQDFNTTLFKEMHIIVDGDHPVGSFIYYIDNMAFVSVVEEPAIKPPKVPEINASSIGNNKIRIWWKNVPYEDGYRLYRNTSSNQGGAGLIAPLGDEVTSYIDSNLSEGIKYYYWVMAYNTHGGGESEWSDSASAVVDMTVKWIYEDRNKNGWWDFSWAGWYGLNTIEVNADKNISTSLTSYYSGESSLKLHFNHIAYSTNWCFGAITTSADGTGYEPSGPDWTDADKGKDISSCDAIEFWVKASNASSENTFKIEIQDDKPDPDTLKTDKVILKDYVQLTNNKWVFARIPLDDFSWLSGIDKTKIKSVYFLQEQYDPSRDWTAYIDEFRFVKAGLTSNPKFKFIYEDAGNFDMKWNHSGIVTNDDGGLSIETSPDEDHNIPICTNNKFKGHTSLKIHVNKTSSGGWGFLWLSGRKDGSGVPPAGWTNDYDKPKNLSSYKYFSFWIKGDNNSKGRLEFQDTYGWTSGKIDITDCISVNNNWQQIKIPLNEIDWKKCSLRRIKELKYIIDSDEPIGEFTCYIDNMEFSGIGEGVFGSCDFVSNFNAVYNGDHILLTWEPVTSDYIVGYNIYYNFNEPGKNGVSLKPNDSPCFVNSRNTSSLKITGFKSKDIIYFAISSVDDNGCESPLSEYVKVTCLPKRKLAAYPNYVKCEDKKTEIWFNVEKEDDVHIKIYNIAGQLVWEKKEHFAVGLNKVDWFKENKDKKLVSSGVYIIYVKGGKIDTTTKLILIKCE